MLLGATPSMRPSRSRSSARAGRVTRVSTLPAISAGSLTSTRVLLVPGRSAGTLAAQAYQCFSPVPRELCKLRGQDVRINSEEVAPGASFNCPLSWLIANRKLRGRDVRINSEVVAPVAPASFNCPLSWPIL
ncbi:hypothetical protein T492DRAFT_841817 [Pavlovales sp. CCMP2436]|nr:hypothetical protein T492DRAFT_841817 [Pavlovales sp. CCMP2436]